MRLKITSNMLFRFWTLLTVIATIAVAKPVAFEERGNDVCKAVNVVIAIGLLKANRADAFCTSYLNIHTVSKFATVNAVHTSTHVNLVVNTATTVAQTTTTAFITSFITSETTFTVSATNLPAKHRIVKVKRTIVVPKFLKNIASSFISEACSCIATTPTKRVTVTNFATVVTSVFTTTTATTTSSSISVTETVVPQTIFIPATFQEVNNQIGCSYEGEEYGGPIIPDTTVFADAEEQCLQACFGLNPTSSKLREAGVSSCAAVDIFYFTGDGGDWACYLYSTPYFGPEQFICNPDGPQQVLFARLN